MKVFLTNEQVAKILSCLSIEEIENHLDRNWELWDVKIFRECNVDGEKGFELTKKKDGKNAE